MLFGCFVLSVKSNYAEVILSKEVSGFLIAPEATAYALDRTAMTLSGHRLVSVNPTARPEHFPYILLQVRNIRQVQIKAHKL